MKLGYTYILFCNHTMTSQVRDLKDFAKFPGEINTVKNVYGFPTLYKVDKKEK